jgi:hypothetical protein
MGGVGAPPPPVTMVQGGAVALPEAPPLTTAPNPPPPVEALGQMEVQGGIGAPRMGEMPAPTHRPRMGRPMMTHQR